MADSQAVDTITFLLTDIDGSARLWETFPETMRGVQIRYEALVRQAVEQHNGVIFRTVGDCFSAAFPDALDAVTAALTAQLFLQTAPWPGETAINVRMALHTGAVEKREASYSGLSLNRTARLLSAAYGGQILLSPATYALVCDQLPPDATLRDAGEHWLKHLSRPGQAFQLLHPALRTGFQALRALDNLDQPSNLPPQTTSFIGREKEIAEVSCLLHTQRLVTLTGSGGVGKTRLALQVGAELRDAFPDGVWFVELAPVVHGEYVVQMVASALNIPEEPGQSRVTSLINALKDKYLLLVLDNCEHVLDACVCLVDTLLRDCPHVYVLASSREALNMVGEQAYRVPSLSLPDPKRNIPLESLTQYEAVRLFIERAVLSRPDFTVTNVTVPAVSAICARLDGIPLALELAAVRVRLLTVKEIYTRLTDAFRLLTGGRRATLPRHQTLRATIDWSYNLLTPQEQRFLACLSVFVGGWTIPAAEIVCSSPADGSTRAVETGEILNLLTALVDKSLVVVDTTGSVARYRLLETVRQYMAAKLTEAGESDATRTRHRDWVIQFVTEADQNLNSPDAALWLDRMDAEYDNIRAALAWCREEAERTCGERGAQVGLLLGSDLMRFWERHGFHSEGRDTLLSLLALPGAEQATPARAAALLGAGHMMYRIGNLALARALYEEALPIEEKSGNQRGIASLLGNLANVLMDLKDYTASRAYLENALVINREVGNRRWEAYNRMSLGNIETYSGNMEGAIPYYDQSLAILREVGDPYGECLALYNIGVNYSALNDWDTAREVWERALVIARESGFQGKIAGIQYSLAQAAGEQGDIATALSGSRQALRDFLQLDTRPDVLTAFAAIARWLHQSDNSGEAAKWYGFVTLQRIRQNIPLSDRDMSTHERDLQEVREALGDAAFLAARSEGEALAWEQGIELALSSESP